MERTVMAQMSTWKQNPKRKPLILSGARQVGKTWLLREFGHKEYDRVIYLNMDESSIAKNIFDLDLNPQRIIRDLAVFSGGEPIHADNTLIIIDEIQQAPRALTSLKYFAENTPEYHVACAGSLLGVASHPNTSFPVGMVNVLEVHPLTFTEFLEAYGQGHLAEIIRNAELPALVPFHDDLVSTLKWYMFLGGMPEAVSVFLDNHNIAAVREVCRELLFAYDRDVSKHAPFSEVPRIRAIFNSIPRQLAQENRRFVYGNAQAGARAKTLELALQWLLDAGTVHKVQRVQTPRIPLATYTDISAFRLFGVDVGLIGTLADLDPSAIINRDALFTEFKGALTEQYVLQSLVAAGLNPYYWVSKSGGAEVDFLLQGKAGVIPLEAKAGVNLQAKSLRVFHSTYSPPVCLRTSLLPFRDEGWVVNIPLYAVDCLGTYIEQI